MKFGIEEIARHCLEALEPAFAASVRKGDIVVGGRNFGVGSSREAAVYALYDYGIRCVIAPSFGDIFQQNCIKNGVLPATVTDADAAALLTGLGNDPGANLTVDLQTQTISGLGRSYAFAIEPSRRAQLLNGWDDVDLTLANGDKIAAFKRARTAAHPWVVPRA
jgi:3-isopropylmalate/(R)-2-methylmalate dehydratase small subunit